MTLLESSCVLPCFNSTTSTARTCKGTPLALNTPFESLDYKDYKEMTLYDLRLQLRHLHIPQLARTEGHLSRDQITKLEPFSLPLSLKNRSWICRKQLLYQPRFR
jgi:hypothetical protein